MEGQRPFLDVFVSFTWQLGLTKLFQILNMWVLARFTMTKKAIEVAFTMNGGEGPSLVVSGVSHHWIWVVGGCGVG